MKEQIKELKKRAEEALEKYGDTGRNHFTDAIRFAEQGKSAKFVELKLNAGLNIVESSEINSFDDLRVGMRVKDALGNEHIISEIGETGVRFEDGGIHRNPEVLREVE